MGSGRRGAARFLVRDENHAPLTVSLFQKQNMCDFARSIQLNNTKSSRCDLVSNAEKRELARNQVAKSSTAFRIHSEFTLLGELFFNGQTALPIPL